MATASRPGRSGRATRLTGANWRANPELAARYALHVMVLGAKICPAHPLAPYCGGCNSKAAQEISDHRMDLAGFYTELRQPN